MDGIEAPLESMSGQVCERCSLEQKRKRRKKKNGDRVLAVRMCFQQYLQRMLPGGKYLFKKKKKAKVFSFFGI